MATLSTERQINLHGTVKVDGTTIISLSANVSSNPNRSTTYTQAITDSVMYYENRTAAREQVDAFQVEVRQVEDELISKEVLEEDIEDPDAPVDPDVEDEPLP